MFELIFGLFWMTITYIMTSTFFASEGLFVNGVIITEKLGEMMPMLLFFAIFWIVGIGVLIVGIRNLVKGFMVSTNGTEACGYIADIYYNGKKVNHVPHFNARIIVVDNGQPLDLQANIGSKRFQYNIGTYVNVKYYQSNAKITSKVLNEYEIPYSLRNWVVENAEILKENQMSTHLPFMRY